MQQMRQVFIPLTGRCFLARVDGNASRGKKHVQYVRINKKLTHKAEHVAHSPLMTSTTLSPLLSSSPSLIGSPLTQEENLLAHKMNDYYRQRFKHSSLFNHKSSVSNNYSNNDNNNNSSSNNIQCEQQEREYNESLRVGDIVMRLVPRLKSCIGHERTSHNRLLSSVHSVQSNLAHMRKSGEHFANRMINEMHMLDGSEVAEVNQGIVSVGKIVLFAVCNAHIKRQSRNYNNNIHQHRRESHMCMIDNAVPLLTERKVLEYQSEYEAMQLIDKMAHQFEELYTHKLLRLKAIHEYTSANLDDGNGDVIQALRFVITKHTSHMPPEIISQ